MIHFDFMVSEEDAENIISALGGVISNDQVIIMELMAAGGPKIDIEFYKRDIEYHKELIKKMTYTQVDS